jgi:hypothetical protein
MSANPEIRGNTLKIYLYLLRHGPSELRNVQRGVGLSSASLASYHLGKLSEAGFRIYSIENNFLLISDADILSYNWTSQEMAITLEASERLTKTGDLYSWTGVVIKIDGEETYHGIFREYIMSAIPASPRICILFPSMLFPSESINYGAIRMFFPFFEPPDDQQVNNAKILQYFEKTGKLRYWQEFSMYHFWINFQVFNRFEGLEPNSYSRAKTIQC